MTHNATVQERIENKYNMLVLRVSTYQELLDTLTPVEGSPPQDVIDSYQEAVERASDYAAQWGFDFDIDVVA